jgi:squalene cyclase
LGKYVAHTESQVIQTAWAMIALLEAGDADWSAITRGAQFLIGMQRADGTWPKQDMAGVFFRMALLDYVLYRQYFPLHALGLYEGRRPAAGRAADKRGSTRPVPCDRRTGRTQEASGIAL